MRRTLNLVFLITLVYCEHMKHGAACINPLKSLRLGLILARLSPQIPPNTRNAKLGMKHLAIEAKICQQSEMSKKP